MWKGQKIMHLKQAVIVIWGNVVIRFGATHIMVSGFDLVQLNWKQLCWWWTVGE